jgi:hypothetical protein
MRKDPFRVDFMGPFFGPALFLPFSPLPEGVRKLREEVRRLREGVRTLREEVRRLREGVGKHRLTAFKI